MGLVGEVALRQTLYGSAEQYELGDHWLRLLMVSTKGKSGKIFAETTWMYGRRERTGIKHENYVFGN